MVMCSIDLKLQDVFKSLTGKTLLNPSAVHFQLSLKYNHVSFNICFPSRSNFDDVVLIIIF